MCSISVARLLRTPQSWALVLIALGVVPAARTAPPQRAATCAALAAEARTFVAAAVSATRVPPAVDRILEGLAPIGGCLSGPADGPVWALVLTGAPALIKETAPDLETGDRVPVGTIEPKWTPMVVTADGGRVPWTPASGCRSPSEPGCEAPGDAVEVGVSLDAAGKERVVDPPSDGSDAPERYVAAKPMGDGSRTLALTVGARTLLLRFDGQRVTTHPAQDALSSLTRVEDVNGDGRPDLVDDASLTVELDASGPMAALPLVALGLPDGSFSTTHPDVGAYYQRLCGDAGRSPWLLGARSEEEVLRRLACAAVAGVPRSTVDAGLEVEMALIDAGKERCRVDLVCGPYRGWTEGAYFASELSNEAVPRLARPDVLVPARVASATSSPPIAAFRAYRFDASQVTDGDFGTAWQPRTARDAWIELTFDGPVTVVALDVANGFQRSDGLGDLFLMNSRPSRLALRAGDKELTLTLDPSSRAVQHLTLPEPLSTRALRITVLEWTKGTKWDQVALSELKALVRGGSATPTPTEAATRPP